MSSPPPLRSVYSSAGWRTSSIPNSGAVRPTCPGALSFGPEPRHPSQLYEAVLEGPVLFFALMILIFRFQRLARPRYIGGAFLAGYGASRILVEFFREPDAHIGYLFGGWLTMGMVLSVPMVAIGVIAMAYAKPPAATAVATDGGKGN